MGSTISRILVNPKFFLVSSTGPILMNLDYKVSNVLSDRDVSTFTLAESTSVVMNLNYTLECLHYI
jgi:hypothetical protein